MGHHLSGRAIAAIAATYIAIGLAVAMAFVDIWRESQDAAARTSRNLAVLVENYFVEVFDQIDLGLLSLAHEAGLKAAAGRIAAERLDTFLARNVTALSETSRFGLADARGQVVYSTGPQAGSASLAEYVTTQEFFVTGAAAPATELHIASGAEPTDPDGLYLTRRVEGRDGSFLGVAFARLPLSQVAEFLARLDIGEHGGISLRGVDMGIVVRHPDPHRLFRGNTRVSPELRALLDGGASRATYFSGATWDGAARTVTFSRAGKYPLYVAVGLAAEDYLADWRRNLMIFAAGYLALAVAGGIVVLLSHGRSGPPARLLTFPDTTIRESRGPTQPMEPHMIPDLPQVIADYFAAANAANGPKAALCFAVDAVVDDEAQPRKGTAEIAAWVVETQAKYRFTATPFAAAASEGRTCVSARVAGNFPGSPVDLDYLFTLADGKIAHLEID